VLVAQLRTWPRRRWLAAVLGAVATALLVGVPTRLVPTPLFTRMVAITWWSWPVWVATAALGGLLVATYVRVPIGVDHPDAGGRTAGLGGLLSVFAVGCPVCNKLVVLALGASGALKFFAPVQPLIGVASLALLAWSLRLRLQGEISCAVRGRVSPAAPPSP
jgi:hypothetical protein